MIRTTIRRVSVLAATTALAGAAFAGPALANGGGGSAEEDLTSIGAPGRSAYGVDVRCVAVLTSLCNTIAVGEDGGSGIARR